MRHVVIRKRRVRNGRLDLLRPGLAGRGGRRQRRDDNIPDNAALGVLVAGLVKVDQIEYVAHLDRGAGTRGRVGRWIRGRGRARPDERTSADVPKTCTGVEGVEVRGRVGRRLIGKLE